MARTSLIFGGVVLNNHYLPCFSTLTRNPCKVLSVGGISSLFWSSRAATSLQQRTPAIQHQTFRTYAQRRAKLIASANLRRWYSQLSRSTDSVPNKATMAPTITCYIAMSLDGYVAPAGIGAIEKTREKSPRKLWIIIFSATMGEYRTTMSLAMRRNQNSIRDFNSHSRLVCFAQKQKRKGGGRGGNLF